MRCTKVDRDVGSWATPGWCPLAKGEVDVMRLRARVIVNAEDVNAACITVEHVKAWLIARGWAPDGGVRGIPHDSRGAWDSWRARKDVDAKREGRGRICVYDHETARSLAALVQETAKVVGVVALDLLDELAESAKAERRSDPA